MNHPPLGAWNAAPSGTRLTFAFTVLGHARLDTAAVGSDYQMRIDLAEVDEASPGLSDQTPQLAGTVLGIAACTPTT